MSFLTPEEREFLRSLWKEAPGDCSECGEQISSARQIEAFGTDLCDKCASIERQHDSCKHGAD
jgi:formylmethanofuran dehydrogenase subunit E